MSRGLDTWYSLPDLDSLARRNKPLTGEIKLARLRRLVAVLSHDRGAVDAEMRVAPRADGQLQLSLSFSTEVELTCQRCLEPLQQNLAGCTEYLLAEKDLAASRAEGSGAQIETLALADEKLNPTELIEDELLVALPYSPRHENADDCGALARTLEKLSDDSGGGQVDSPGDQ